MSLFQDDQQYILHTYKRLPLEISYGKGSYLYDIHDVAYLDMFAGIAVNALGYQHKALQKVLKEQSSKHLHLSNYFVTQTQTELAKRLLEGTHFSKVFYTNSGTETIEASIKLVRKYHNAHQTGKTEMIALKNAFHGRTMGALSLTGQEKYRKGYDPLLTDIKHIEINQISQLSGVINEHTAAVYIEIIQGESGIHEVSKRMISKLVELKEHYGFLIVVDEIQTGLYRTGMKYAYMHHDIKPDLITVAKALGGGLPLGALLISPILDHVFSYGDHGTTFGGNPLACALGIAVMDECSTDRMMRQINRHSSFLIRSLKTLKKQYPLIQEIRGKGFMIGIEVGPHAQAFKDFMFEEKILINITNQTVIRLLPPLNITRSELNQFLETFEKYLKITHKG